MSVTSLISMFTINSCKRFCSFISQVVRNGAVVMAEAETKTISQTLTSNSTTFSNNKFLNEECLPKVLYKSEHFLAISKCFDIKINSDNKDEMSTEHQLRHMFPELVDEKCKHGFRFVHRLDFSTSGVICLGLNKKSAAHLDRQFKRKAVLKFYIALVRGHMKDSSILVDVATGDLQDQEWPNRRCAADHSACINPRNTQTLIMCLETGLYDGAPASKLLLRPFTGRTHQLRVHSQYLGHTIVGDYTYSDRQDTQPHRMMLHSHRLVTDTGLENLDITSPDPFTPELDTRWCPKHIVSDYTDCIEWASKLSLGEIESRDIRKVTLRVDES